MLTIVNYNKDEYNFPALLVLGCFDAIHIGHEELLKKAKLQAKINGLDLGVMMFNAGKGGKQLYSFEERCAFLEKFNVKFVLNIDFTDEFKKTTAAEFLETVEKFINVKGYMSGKDFRFGAGAKGKSATLKKYADDEDNAVWYMPVKDVTFEGEKVSTTLIKECLEQGAINRATQLLGREYSVKGVVTDGHERGTPMGIPTANIVYPENKAEVKQGVYGVDVSFDGNGYKGVANYGGRPTFGEESPVLETYIVDYSGDLYGKEITVSFKNYIRDIRKFEDADALAAQIHSDICRIGEADSTAEDEPLDVDAISAEIARPTEEATEVVEPAIAEPVEEIAEPAEPNEEPAEEKAEEVIEPAVEEPVEEIAEPVEETPVEEALVEEPVEETPVEEALVEEPVEETPAEEVHVEEPIEEIPVEEPAEEITEEPTEEIPAEEPAVEETIVEEPAIAEPVEEVTEPEITEPIAEPAEEKAEEVIEPAAEETIVEELTEEIIEEPTEEIEEEPTEEIPAEEPTEEPVEEPAEEVTEPVEESVAEPVAEPAAEETIVEEPTEEITEEPAAEETIVEEPTEEIIEEPAEEIPAEEIPAEEIHVEEPTEEIPAEELAAEPVEEVTEPETEEPAQPEKELTPEELAELEFEREFALLLAEEEREKAEKAAKEKENGEKHD